MKHLENKTKDMEKYLYKRQLEDGNKLHVLRVLIKSAYSILITIVTIVEALLLSLEKMNYKWITCKITKNITSILNPPTG